MYVELVFVLRRRQLASQNPGGYNIALEIQCEPLNGFKIRSIIVFEQIHHSLFQRCIEISPPLFFSASARPRQRECRREIRSTHTVLLLGKFRVCDISRNIIHTVVVYIVTIIIIIIIIYTITSTDSHISGVCIWCIVRVCVLMMHIPILQEGGRRSLSGSRG